MPVYIKQRYTNQKPLSEQVNDLLNRDIEFKKHLETNSPYNYVKLFECVNSEDTINTMLNHLEERIAILTYEGEALNEDVRNDDIRLVNLRKEKALLENLHRLTQEALGEGVIDAVVNVFKDIKHYKERVLDGYSPGQVDRLIQKASNIHNEESKGKVLREILDAIQDAKKELSDVSKSDHHEEKNGAKIEALKHQIDVLEKLRTKVQSLNPSMFKINQIHDRDQYGNDHETKSSVNIDEM